MIAYKGFVKGLICRGYQFSMGLNVTEKANCGRNGFHCASNPVDCLVHYPNIRTSVYYLVDAGGDLDEDNQDSKISCTELTVLKELDVEQLLLHGLAYMVDHPLLPWSGQVSRDHAKAQGGYAIVRGPDPAAKGELGDILALARESELGDRIEEVALSRVDGENILPNVWYGIDWKERRVLP